MLSLLLGGQRYSGIKRQGETDFAFSLDAVLSESHRFRSRVTTFPVESGSVISDHVINEPEEITLTGHVTNTPIQLLGGALSGAVNDDRVQTAFDVLTALHEDSALVTVVSGLKVYEDMLITSLYFPRDRRTGQAIEFTVTMQKIVTAVFESTLMPDEPNSAQASPEQNVGAQPTVEEVEVTSESTFEGYSPLGAIPVPP